MTAPSATGRRDMIARRAYGLLRVTHPVPSLAYVVAVGILSCDWQRHDTTGWAGDEKFFWRGTWGVGFVCVSAHTAPGPSLRSG